MQAKAQKLPVIVSMGALAASGGYWVSTAGDMIFAEPNTITGSIGIFGIIPTFENTLKKIGVTTDGVQDHAAFRPAGCRRRHQCRRSTRFSRRGSRTAIASSSPASPRRASMTPERVNEIAQGHVWDGGTARQIRAGRSVRRPERRRRRGRAPRRARSCQGAMPNISKRSRAGRRSSPCSWPATMTTTMTPARQGDAFTRIAAQRRAVFAQALGD